MFGRETETETERERRKERERDYLRDPMKSPHPVFYSFFCLLFSFSYRIMLCYIILYKTTGILYTWSDGKEGGMYICMCVCVCMRVGKVGYEQVLGMTRSFVDQVYRYVGM